MGVTGSLGDSQCYVGVLGKVAAVQRALSERVRRDDLAVRLIAPAYTIGVSDGQLNGTPGMRFSLIGRELVNESIDLHLNANSMAGLIAVVACDKPPVGTLAAILEHNAPAVLMSDGSIRPGTDPQTGERIDIITGFQVAADPDRATRTRVALHGCPGQGSCGGMFTYNTMQTFIALLGMEPLQMVAPPSDDPRRVKEFSDQLIDCLVAMTDAGITPRDIVTPTSLRNALTVTIAMGGSTNVVLHSVEIARAAGLRGLERWLARRGLAGRASGRGRPRCRRGNGQGAVETAHRALVGGGAQDLFGEAPAAWAQAGRPSGWRVAGGDEDSAAAHCVDQALVLEDVQGLLHGAVSDPVGLLQRADRGQRAVLRVGAILDAASQHVR